MGDTTDMTTPFRVAMAQMNARVGGVAENARRIADWIGQARRASAHLVSFPEMAVTGYPPEDLLFHPRFVDENLRAIETIAKQCGGITAVVGYVDRDGEGRLYNAAAVIHDGGLADVYHKCHLPNYGVFDEKRYFTPGTRRPVYDLGGVAVGVNICEDIWVENGPAYDQAVHGGARVIVNINASPYHAGKREAREELLACRATEGGAYICYNNLVGGQDELVFDGHSLMMAPDGSLLARGPSFEETLIVADLDLPARPAGQPPDGGSEGPVAHVSLQKKALPVPKGKVDTAVAPVLPRLEEIHQALLTGIRDYLGKNGFQTTLIGLSGGIDSALVAALAAEALGPEQVNCVYMPSRYSSAQSEVDARALAANIGVELSVISIEGPFAALLEELAPFFKGKKPDTTEENLQPRVRGNLLMALSNKFGHLVLTTGNKSEMAVGYATLYGDMAGGFAVIKDLPKTLVFDLCRHINDRAGREVIPKTIIEKPPTAELRENQKDTDSLPPYAVLDPILEAYVEKNRSVADIVAEGFDEETVCRVIRMVDLAEYKRRQAPPGIRITPRAFGRDRRMPISNRFRE